MLKGNFKRLGCAGLVGGLLLVGCATQPGEKTQLGATTGGVVGAGLGAIIGNQMGHPASGLLLGAAAGAGTGAWVGQNFDEHDANARIQDEAIARQERQLSAQRRELDELRRGVDSPRSSVSTGSFRSPSISQSADERRLREAYARARTLRGDESSNARFSSRQIEREHVVAPKIVERHPAPVARIAPRVEPKVIQPVERTQPKLPPQPRLEIEDDSSYQKIAPNGGGIVERDISADPRPDEDSGVAPAVDTNVEAPKGTTSGEENALDWSKDSDTAAVKVRGDVVSAPGECAEAQEEVRKGDISGEVADKLFHFRRALRLCPSDAALHNRLGEVYNQLSRPSDAAYEFKEALKIDPNLEPAKDNLASLGR